MLDRAPGAKVRYSFADTGLHLVLRPVQPTDDRLMPVVASPDIARAAGGVGGTTVLDFQDTQIISLRTGLPHHIARGSTSGNPLSTFCAICASTLLLNPAMEFCSCITSGRRSNAAIIPPGKVM